MNAIVCLSLLSWITLSNDRQHLSFPSACPTAHIQIVSKGALACELQRLAETSDCVVNYIRISLNQQWNVIVKNQGNTDYVAFWSPTACAVQLKDFGNKYNRTYIAWANSIYINQNQTKQQHYQNSTQPSLAFNIKNPYQNSPLLSHKHLTVSRVSNLRESCEQWKFDSATNMVKYCDAYENDRVAECIKDRIKNELDEYWNVFVKLLHSSSSNLSFSPQACFHIIQGEGKNKRYIVVWYTQNY